MPTPLGHALAGASVAWLAQSVRRMPKDGGDTRLAITCAELAVAADLDFIYPPIHRMMTHSLTAVVAVTVAAWLIARRADRRPAPSFMAIVCGLAYGSHLAMDWIAGDTKLPPGIQLLWPFSDAWFISSWGVFGATSLGGFFRPETMLSNALTILRELLITGPVAFIAWSVRRRTLAGNGNATAGLACGPPRS